MSFACFAAGFGTAVLVMLVIMFLIFFRIGKQRKSLTVIKGYLDLIPDLSPIQREQVSSIRSTFLPRVADIRKNLRQSRAQLADFLFEEPADRAKIDTVAGEIMARQSELEKEVIAHILEEKELLSPSQQRKFYEIIVEQFSSGSLGVHDVRNRNN
ncbi:MAG: Spy/CpxP family protein refolding chaperone [Desulfobacterales bacterium]